MAPSLLLGAYKKWIWMGAFLVLAVVLARQDSEWFNFGETLQWTPGQVVACNSVQDVLDVVENAKTSGQRVKAFGTGWSWSTTIASDGDTYVQLTGDLANAAAVQIDTSSSQPTATVGAGVTAFDLYMVLQNTDYNIEAKGNCLTADESQTIGGLLATNVHHTGIKTFYDVVEWVEVVTSASGLVRAVRDDPLFRLTIGGGGRTGVMVNVQFKLAPRIESTYEEATDIAQPVDTSYEAFFQGYADATNSFGPMELILVGLKPAGILEGLADYSGYRRLSPGSTNPAVLPSDFGEIGLLARTYLFTDPAKDFLLPSFCYDAIYQPALVTLLAGEQADTEGKMGVDLDVACSDSYTVRLKHQEMEFFVPVNLVKEVGAYMDARFDEGKYPYIRDHGLFALRKVFGCNSTTAANGVLADGSNPDFIAVNVDSYQRKRWGQYNFELNALMADLSAQFPRQIRTHPGKYNPPLSPDPEPDSVKAAIAAFDPFGTFARDAYDPTYLTEEPEEC